MFDINFTTRYPLDPSQHAFHSPLSPMNIIERIGKAIEEAGCLITVIGLIILFLFL